MQELPEDLEQWPRSPFDILGVGSAVSREELRRAWLRLVRRFKPDRFPKHFQRLKEAFDSADKVLKYHQTFTDEAAAVPSIPSETAPTDLATDDNHENGTSSPLEQNRSRFDRYEVWKPIDWQSAFNQENWALAAEQLAENLRRLPNQLEFHYGRLLLSHAREKPADTNPESRLKLIFDSLSDRDQEPALRWLEWELLQHPPLASSQQWQAFLESGRSLATSWSLLQSRWMALGWQSVTSVINDVRRLVDGRGPMDRTWYEMLIRSVEFTIWHDDPKCREHEDFIKKTVNLEFSWSQVPLLNRLDECLNMGQQWRREKHRNENLVLALAPPACTVHPLRFLEHLESACRLAVDSPQFFLQRHDWLVRTCQSVFSAILRGLQALNGYRGDAAGFTSGYCDPNLVLAFLGTHGSKPYRSIRLPLLNYCQAFGSSLQAFAITADSLPLPKATDESGTWSFTINADLNLLLLEQLLKIKLACPR